MRWGDNDISIHQNVMNIINQYATLVYHLIINKETPCYDQLSVNSHSHEMYY